MKLECDMTNVSHHLIRHLILDLISFIHSGARLQRLLVCNLCDPFYLITNRLRSPQTCVQSCPRWPGHALPLLPRSDTLTLRQQCEARHREPETGGGCSGCCSSPDNFYRGWNIRVFTILVILISFWDLCWTNRSSVGQGAFWVNKYWDVMIMIKLIMSNGGVCQQPICKMKPPSLRN